MQNKIFRVDLTVSIEAESKKDSMFLLREILESTDEENRQITFKVKSIKVDRKKTNELMALAI